MIRRHLSSPFLLDSRVAAPSGGAQASDGAANIRRPALSHRARAFALLLLLVGLWTGLLGWVAEVPLGAAFQPAERMRFVGSDFHVVMGAGIENDKRLGINAVGAAHMALQSIALARPIDAAAYPVLRYRWQDFPRTLELSFVFRRADQPDDVHTVTLPPAAAHPGYFDLSDVADWHGRITEIGFAEFPTAQLVPADIAFRPFSLVEAELWTPSWRGSLGALGTDWSAYRPWALMSVSALGPDAPWPHKPTPVLLLAIGLTASLVIASLVLARGARWLGIALCLALAGGWLALDLRWLGEFTDRHLLTRELYAGKSWRERATIEPDTALVAGAARVRELLARAPAGTHVIVAAAAVYDVLRLSYHLLPANVAPMGVLSPSNANGKPMQPALLVVYADPDWTFDAARKALSYAKSEYAAELVYDEGDLRIFSIRGAAP
ncbi:MAG TPA: hypothetical protein VKB52_06870 [Rhodanobacteraceae bacterium]|nr:hypothetical protein [Rhodanobacteraceae bacterium]